MKCFDHNWKSAILKPVIIIFLIIGNGNVFLDLG